MSKRYWISAIAFGLVISAYPAWTLWESYRRYQLEHAEQRDNAAQYAASAGSENIQRCIGIGKFSVCYVKSIETEDEDKYTKYDLKAQQDMAEFSWIAAISSLATVMLTAIGVVLIWRTLVYTRDAVVEAKSATKAAEGTIAVTRHIGSAQIRPWVIASVEIARDLLIVEGKPALRVWLNLKNIGNSSARSVRVAFQPRILDTELSSPFYTATQLENYRMLRMGTHYPRPVPFPEARFAIAPQSGIRLERDSPHIDIEPGDPFNVVLMVSVTYEGEGIETFADTHSAFLFRVSDENGGFRSHTLTEEGIKADRIGFDVLPMGFVT